MGSYTGVSLIPTDWYMPTDLNELTQVEILEKPTPERSQPQEKRRQNIQKLDPIKPIASNDPARFESENTQRVEKETRAARLGMTANAGTPAKSQTKQQPTEKSDEGDLPEFARATSQRTARYDSSAVSVELPNDIQVASATNLNTDATTNASFYNRVEQLVYIRWVERLDYYWSRISYEFKKDNLFGRIWRTQVTILLNAEGIYDSAIIERSSGYKPFDEAVIYAFKNAHYFPNVPKNKVESDGMVRLRYSFNLNIGSYR